MADLNVRILQIRLERPKMFTNALEIIPPVQARDHHLLIEERAGQERTRFVLGVSNLFYLLHCAASRFALPVCRASRISQSLNNAYSLYLIAPCSA
jgi:hypothetical protein